MIIERTSHGWKEFRDDQQPLTVESCPPWCLLPNSELGRCLRHYASNSGGTCTSSGIFTVCRGITK